MTRQHRAARPEYLDTLSDTELLALLHRTEALLLDRPRDVTGLSVEVVAAEEARLLALYRALRPEQPPAALAAVESIRSTPASDRGRDTAHFLLADG